MHSHIFRVQWTTPQQGTLPSGYKIYTSPPPGSGVIVQSILNLFDNVVDKPVDQMPEEEVYLKLIESFKFAYAQRSKLGDTFNNNYTSEIEKVSGFSQMKVLVIRSMHLIILKYQISNC